MRSAKGFTFIELMVVTAIIMILASVAVPLAQVAAQREREAELHRNLREMRTAIDKFKDAVDQGLIPATELDPANEGYPKTLETLVEGVSVANDASGRKLKFRRAPTGGSAPIRIDPTRRRGAGRTCSRSTPRATASGSTGRNTRTGKDR
jgi:general secretion pathway protein G